MATPRMNQYFHAGILPSGSVHISDYIPKRTLDAKKEGQATDGNSLGVISSAIATMIFRVPSNGSRA